MIIPKIKILFLLIFGINILIAAQEDIRPDAPYILRVTVDTATNNTHIYWVESRSANVETYIIYQETEHGGVIIEELSAPANHYVHVASGAGRNKVSYSIAAVDSLGNISTREEYPKHSTVFISSVYDSCNNRMILSWNNYIGWADSIAGYRLFRSRNNMVYENLAGLSSDTVYVDNGITEQGITENTQYEYYVVARKNDGLESYSNITRKYTYMPGPPESLVLDYTSIAEKNLVQLSFSFTDTSSLNDFALLRSRQKNADFLIIRSIPNVSSNNLIVYDTIITERDEYFYKIGALNSCYRVIKESNLGVNILLKGNSSGSDILLQWNPYEEFVHGIQEYIIYRRDPNMDFIQHATTNNSTNSFTDNISDMSGMNIPGEIAYRISVVENVTGIVANSNEILIPIETEILLPNAFTPDGDGINDVLKPVLNFLPEEFTFLIYDRSGIRIFQSTDPAAGWDGKINGKQAAEGVYMYYIEYKSFNGIRKNLKPGTITLFYPH